MKQSAPYNRHGSSTRVFEYPLTLIFIVIFLLAAILLMPLKPVAIGVVWGINLAQITARLLFATPLFIYLLYLFAFSLTIKADRLVIGGFKKREILFRDIVAMKMVSYKGAKEGTFTLSNGQTFGVDSWIKNYKEAIEMIRRAMP